MSQRALPLVSVLAFPSSGSAAGWGTGVCSGAQSVWAHGRKGSEAPLLLLVSSVLLLPAGAGKRPAAPDVCVC